MSLLPKKRLLAIAVIALSFAARGSAQNAPGGPGAVPTWTAGSKEAVGTATVTQSHVWFTLEGRILTEVYYPRLDTANLRTLEFAVSDGKATWAESKDMRHSLERVNNDALLYRQSSSDPGGKFKIEKTYATDPQRDAVLIDVAFTAPAGYELYVLADPALKNSGYGDTGFTQDGALVMQKEDVACALASSPAFSQASSGVPWKGDGYTDLLLHHKLTWKYERPEKGNIFQAAKLGSTRRFTLALGFGASAAAAIDVTKKSLGRKVAEVSDEYVAGWEGDVKGLGRGGARYDNRFQLEAVVQTAHQDKPDRGAIILVVHIPVG